MQYDDKTIKILLKNARYKGEYFLNIVSIFLTLLISYLLIYACYNLRANPLIADAVSDYIGISHEFIEYLSVFNSFAIIILFLSIIVAICFYNTSYRIKAGFRNFSIDVMPDKQSFYLYERYCNLLGINMPTLFLNSNVYDSSIFGVKIRGTKAIGISTKAYLDIIRRNDYHAFNYQVTSTLGSIYLGHYDLWFQLLTFWARLIPFYKKMYSRALSYSTDRVAQILMGTNPLIIAIARETSGMDIFTDEMAEELLNPKDFNMTRFEKSVAFLYDWISEYPLAYFRLSKILENDDKDKELINNELSKNN